MLATSKTTVAPLPVPQHLPPVLEQPLSKHQVREVSLDLLFPGKGLTGERAHDGFCMYSACFVFTPSSGHVTVRLPRISGFWFKQRQLPFSPHLILMV